MPADLIKALSLDNVTELSLDSARLIQSRLGEMIRTTTNRFDRAQFAAMAEAIAADIEAFGAANGGAYNNALRQATDVFREEVARIFLNDAAGRRTFVSTIGRVKPELVVDAIHTVGDVVNLRQALGAGSNEFRFAQQAYVQRMLDQSTDALTGQFDPAAFLRVAKRQQPEMLTEFLGPYQAKAFYDTVAELRAGARVTDTPFLTGVAKMSPEKLVEQVSTVNDVRDLQRLLGPNSPDMEQVRQGVMRRLIRQVTDPVTEQIRPAAFVKVLRDQDEFLTALVGNRRMREVKMAAHDMARTGRTEANPFLKTLMGQRPDDVVKSVKSVSDVFELRRVLGPTSPEFEALQRGYMQRVIEKSIDPTTSIFRPQRLLQQLVGDVTPEFRAALFGDRARDLERFLNVLSRQVTFSGERLGGKESAAGFLGAVQVYSGAAGLPVAAAFGSPQGMLLSTLSLVTPVGIAKLLTSKWGIQRLTEGFRLPANQQGLTAASRIVADIMAFAGDER